MAADPPNPRINLPPPPLSDGEPPAGRFSLGARRPPPPPPARPPAPSSGAGPTPGGPGAAPPPRLPQPEGQRADDARPARPLIDLDRARVELPAQSSRFQPREPRTWEELGVEEIIAEQIVLRYLLGVGSEAGRALANELCIAQNLVRDLLEGLRTRKLIQHRGSTAVGDFVYELTEQGRDRAIDYRRQCTYVGPVPVPMDQYLHSVEEQTLRHLRPTAADLDRAFADMVVHDNVLARLGPAVASCRALFLYGEPGNGKTSIAERVMRVFGDSLWIPQTLFIDGHLVKLFDPATHVALDAAYKPLTTAERLDRRWLRIRRPTVVAGGELTLEMLEIQQSPHTHICEAPLQLKANGGTLVIDDFGRQRIPPQVLLNRWIFPLERRIDFLRLPDGRKITAPFDPLLVFSTNLEPRELMDEAFLRRIPYKIHVVDPTEDEFFQLIEILAPTLDVVLEEGSVEYLIERHYKRMKRPFRFCHPRDLLQQVANQAAFDRRPALATRQAWDDAVANYFGTM